MFLCNTVIQGWRVYSLHHMERSLNQQDVIDHMSMFARNRIDHIEVEHTSSINYDRGYTVNV